VPTSQFVIQARLDVEARPPALGKKQANEGEVGTNPFALGPDVLPQLFNFVIGLLDRPMDGILELVALLQDKGLVKILLVLKELVERPDGELGLLGDLVHGDTVVSALREELESGGEHFLALALFLALPP
jgi:hypothetical protein